MDTEKYIASGILELYVAGTLSEEENLDIARYAQEYPEIKREIEAIEAAILALTKAAAPKNTSNKGYTDLKKQNSERKGY